MTYIWEYKKGKWYFNPRQGSYGKGNEDVTRKIKYVDKPCKINKKKKRITCKIGSLKEYSHWRGYYKEHWSTSRTLLEGNFEKTALLTYPHFGGQRDVDVCYVEGTYNPFQSK